MKAGLPAAVMPQDGQIGRSPRSIDPLRFSSYEAYALQSVSSTVTFWRGPSQAHNVDGMHQVRKIDGGWDFKVCSRLRRHSVVPQD